MSQKAAVKEKYFAYYQAPSCLEAFQNFQPRWQRTCRQHRRFGQTNLYSNAVKEQIRYCKITCLVADIEVTASHLILSSSNFFWREAGSGTCPSLTVCSPIATILSKFNLRLFKSFSKRCKSRKKFNKYMQEGWAQLLETCLYLSNLRTYQNFVYLNIEYRIGSMKRDFVWRNSSEEIPIKGWTIYYKINKFNKYMQEGWAQLLETCLYLSNLRTYQNFVYLNIKYKTGSMKRDFVWSILSKFPIQHLIHNNNNNN